MEKINELIKNGNPQEIALYMKENGLVIKNGKIVPVDDKVNYVKEQITFWDQRQQARKILLNSLYGALLNEALRFNDERMGQSVTLTGRSIVRHMTAQVNKEITGEYDYLGETIKYNDTDSVYFSIAYKLSSNTTRENYIKIYDSIADVVNMTFPDFMHNNFNTTRQRGAIIAAGRELVASKMLFIKKKKYGGLVYDLDGIRQDVNGKPGKLKAMGLDLKRADTPKYMQEFLEQILLEVLTGADEKEIIQQIKDFRVSFKDKPAWEKGSPKKVSNLSKYHKIMERADNMSLTDKRGRNEKARVTIPGHVRASVNWNDMCNHHRDRFSMRITDGSRIIVCKLLPNQMKIDSIAYPIDEPHLPEWFKKLPFDETEMENVIITKKVHNLLSVLNWSLQDTMVFSGEEFFSFK